MHRSRVIPCRAQRPPSRSLQQGRIDRRISSAVVHQRSSRSSLPARRFSTAPPTKKIVFSGIQPTGQMHLGNYLGAVRPWVKAQNDAQTTIISVVDLHSLTAGIEPVVLRRGILEMSATLIAAGIDAKNTILFQQSAVSQHSELMWIFSCITPLGPLQRMIQFKEKAKKGGEEVANLGLLAYPVLQCADILLYRATHVPVGEDQRQHLELASRTASTFNRTFNTMLFPVPQAVFPVTCARRIMSLRDPTTKMSKSDASDMSRINLSDSAELIAQKIRRATTDSESGITYDATKRPALANLLSIFAEIEEKTPEVIAASFSSSPMTSFKDALARSLGSHLAPISAKLKKLEENDFEEVQKVLKEGNAKAVQRAQETMKQVRKCVGFE